MSSKSLVICDWEEKYAAAFAAFITGKKELAFQVQICSTLEHVAAIQNMAVIDYLFITAEFPKEARDTVAADKKFVLTVTGNEQVGEEEYAVYKYQPGEAILSQMFKACDIESGEDNVFFQTLRKKEAEIIGVYSPVHRTGKTAYALELGKSKAAKANVLYINMEPFGGAGGHFPEDAGQTLSDVFYYLRQESRNLGLLLTTVVRHMGALDYILPVPVSEDVKTVSPQEWTSLVRQIMEKSIYEILVLDIDESIQGLYQVLNLCTEIRMPVLNDTYSRAKIRQFDRELEMLGMGGLRRIIKEEEMNDNGRTAS